PRIHRPGTSEDIRILDGGLIAQRVADAGYPFDDFHVVAVKPAIDADPGLIVEAQCFDNERAAFPVGDRVAVVEIAHADGRLVVLRADGDLTERVAGAELI